MKKILLLSVFFTSSLFSQNCRKFLLTTDFEDIKSDYQKSLNAMISSTMNSSKREIIQKIINKKFTDKSFVFYLKQNGSNLTSRFNILGNELVTEVNKVENLKENIYMFEFSKKDYILLDLNSNRAIIMPESFTFNVTESLCEF